MSDDEPLIDWNDPVLWAWIRTYRTHTLKPKRKRKPSQPAYHAVEGECIDCHRILLLSRDHRCRNCHRRWRRHHDPKVREQVNRLKRERYQRLKQRQQHQQAHKDKEQE